MRSKNLNLIAYTPDPERAVACAAKLCYSNADSIGILANGLTDEKVAKFIRHLSNMGHRSPVEHVSFTFAIEGGSRALLAQLTRRRIASYSVQSQRYVSMEVFKYEILPEIQADSERREVFIEGVEVAGALIIR